MKTVAMKKYRIKNTYTSLDVSIENGYITIDVSFDGRNNKITFHKSDVLELETAFRKCLDEEEND